MSAKYISLTDRLAEVPWIAKHKSDHCEMVKYRRGPKPCKKSASLIYIRPSGELVHCCVFHAADEFDYELNDGAYIHGNKRAIEYNKVSASRFKRVYDIKGGKMKYIRNETA